MFRLGFGAVLGSLALMYLGFQEWNLSSGASSEPEEMTLQALIQRGPQGSRPFCAQGKRSQAA